MDSFHKLDMASVDWLRTHYLAKSNLRFQDLASLDIKTGSKVLDLCCGSGLYMPHFLNLVGPEGSVTGVDIDPVSLDAAHMSLSASTHTNWTLEQSSVDKFIDKVKGYDLVVLFNCIGYFEKPHELITKLAKNMSPNSSILIKDFDMESFFFQPRNTTHWSSLINTSKAINDGENSVKFNNYFGRNVHTLHSAFSFRNWKNFTWTQYMTFPFNDHEKEYLWRNVECLINQSSGSCSKEVQAYFQHMFYPPSSKFFEDKSAMFIEVEYLTRLEL